MARPAEEPRFEHKIGDLKAAIEKNPTLEACMVAGRTLSSVLMLITSLLGDILP
jgi:hypothetical protein